MSTPANLTHPAFTNEDKAREVIEASRWPNGPTCPWCNKTSTVKALGGHSMGPGWYRCSECDDKFTVRVGTVLERSHIPLHKWLLASHLMSASKKGVSALQLQRMLGLGSYRTAWFMCHRIREAMMPADAHGRYGFNRGGAHIAQGGRRHHEDAGNDPRQSDAGSEGHRT